MFHYPTDPSLHHHSLEEGVATDLIVILRGVLEQASLPTSATDPENTAKDDSLKLLSPTFHCLWLLAHFSCDLRQELSGDASFLQDTFHGMLFSVPLDYWYISQHCFQFSAVSL